MTARRTRGTDRGWTLNRAAVAAACAVLTAVAGCGSDDESGKSSSQGSSDQGDKPAKVAVAVRGVHTASFEGKSKVVGNRYSWRLEVRGRIDRDHERSAIVVKTDAMRASGASTEYRTFGRTSYLRQLTPLAGDWVRQRIRAQGPVPLPYALATGKIFGFPRRLSDPVEKVSEGSVRGVSVTEYKAELRESRGDTVFGFQPPSGPIHIWLDSRNRMRRLRFSTGSTSQDPAMGSLAGQVSVDFFAINEPVSVARPR